MGFVQQVGERGEGRTLTGRDYLEDDSKRSFQDDQPVRWLKMLPLRRNTTSYPDCWRTVVRFFRPFSFPFGLIQSRATCLKPLIGAMWVFRQDLYEVLSCQLQVPLCSIRPDKYPYSLVLSCPFSVLRMVEG